MQRFIFTLFVLFILLGVVNAAETNKRYTSTDASDPNISSEELGSKPNSSKYVFRGLVFGSKPTEDMKATYDVGTKIGLPENEKIVQSYTRNNEELTIGDLDIAKITYSYYDSQLFHVEISINSVSASIDKMLENKFGAIYKKSKYQQTNDFLSRATGSKVFVKTVSIPSLSLQIYVRKRSEGRHVNGGTTLIYSDTQIGNIVRKLARERDVYVKKRGEYKKEEAIRNSKDQL